MTIFDRWETIDVNIIGGPDADEEINTGPTDISTKFVDEGTAFIDGERLPNAEGNEDEIIV